MICTYLAELFLLQLTMTFQYSADKSIDKYMYNRR